MFRALRRFVSLSNRVDAAPARRRRSGTRRFESLEERALFATYAVTSSSAGPSTTVGTLAWAITQANQNVNDHDTISLASGLTVDVNETSFPTSLPALLGPTSLTGDNATIRGVPDSTGDRPEWGLWINDQRNSGGILTTTISGVTITGFEAAGIYVQQLYSASYIDIVGNTVRGNENRGIWSEAEQRTRIWNNSLYDNGFDSIYIEQSGPGAVGSEIRNNSRIGDFGEEDGITFVNALNFEVKENTIGADGVVLSGSSAEIGISNNTFRIASGIPIDLRGTVGQTTNDPGDGDSGPNNLLNFPDISMFALNAGSWTVTGTLDTDANSQAAEIQFYKYSAGTYTYIKSINGTLDGSGYWAWQASFTDGTELNEGEQIAALTIITGPRHTSEMSPRATAPSDIVVNSFGADATDPHYLSVNYTINGSALAPFRMGVYRSVDNVRVLEYSPTTAERAPGTRSVRILVDGDFDSASDLAQNYSLVVRLDDNADQIQELNETNNEAAFAGGVFQAPLGALHVHGQPGTTVVDTVTTSQTGTTLSVTLNGATKTFTVSGVPAIHIRTHGGNDSVTRTAVDAIMSLWGGDGDDTLNISGVASMPTGVSKFDPGVGNNALNVNSGKVFLDTPWTSVNDSLAVLNTTVKGGAELKTNRLWQTSLTITESSKAMLAPDNSPTNTASKLNSLTINPGSTLDITDQALIIDYTGGSPIANIRTWIISGARRSRFRQRYLDRYRDHQQHRGRRSNYVRRRLRVEQPFAFGTVHRLSGSDGG